MIRIIACLLALASLGAVAAEGDTETIISGGRTMIVREDAQGQKIVDRIWGELRPDEKCTDIDARIIHLCLQPRFFDPSARIYFDSGTDDPNELDIFNDGALNPTIDFAAVYVPWRLGRSAYFDQWSWGPMLGIGISAPAGSSDTAMADSSDAPVVMVSYGLMIEYEFNDAGPSFALEFGRATGFSSDEGLSDSDDSATFVGLKLNVPMPTKEKKTVTEAEAKN